MADKVDDVKQQLKEKAMIAEQAERYEDMAKVSSPLSLLPVLSLSHVRR